MGTAATVWILAKLSELRGGWWSKDETRELRALTGELGRPSAEVGAADASTAARPLPVREPETTTTTATQVTQSSVLAVPATQIPSPVAPMDTSETRTEPGRDVDVCMAEHQPKRRREPEDVEMTAVLAQLVSEGTYEFCGLLVHADIADNSYIEEEVVNESMRGETENVNAATLVAISVHDAANPDGCQPELLEKDTIVYGHMSGQPLLEDAVREARGRVICLMADHGRYDIVARGAARGKLVRANWLDDWGTNGVSSRLVAQQFNWAKT